MKEERKLSKKRAVRALWVVVIFLLLLSASCIASVVRAEEFELDPGVTVLWNTAKSDGGLPPPVRFKDPNNLWGRCGEMFALSGDILRIGCPGTGEGGGTLYFGTLGVGLWLYLDRVGDPLEQGDPRVACLPTGHCFVGDPDENTVVEGVPEGGDSIAVVTLSFAGVSLHPGDRFGSSVWAGPGGKTLIVGASDFGGNGRAFLFRRTGPTSFTLTGVCEDPFAPSGAELGYRVFGTARGEVFAAEPGRSALMVCHFPPEEVYPPEIFSDGWESGDLSAWSAVVP